MANGNNNDLGVVRKFGDKPLLQPTGPTERGRRSPLQGAARDDFSGAPAEETNAHFSRPRYASRERVRQYEMDKQENREARAEHAAREKFIGYAETASARHPEIDQQVFKDIIAAYDAEREDFRARVQDIQANAPSKGYLRVDMQQARNDIVRNIHKRIDHHGGAATIAMNAISAEKQPESVFTPIVRMFYNSDKGGLQVGGLGGAAALGGLAYYIGESSGMGTIMKWALTLGSTMLGAYAGGKAFPGTDTLKVPNFRGPAIAPKGPVKTPELDLGSPAQEQLQASTLNIPDMKLSKTEIVHTPLKGTELQGFSPDSSVAQTQTSNTQTRQT